MDYEGTTKLLEALARAGVASFKCADFEVTFAAKTDGVVTRVREYEVAKESQTVAKPPEPGTAGAVTPSESEIPHSVNVVQSLLRMGDNELAERLFPDMTAPSEESA